MVVFFSKPFFFLQKGDIIQQEQMRTGEGSGSKIWTPVSQRRVEIPTPDRVTPLTVLAPRCKSSSARHALRIIRYHNSSHMIENDRSQDRGEEEP